MAEQYVVLDFETTGLSPKFNEIIQIGAAKFDSVSHEELGRVNQLLRPVRSLVSAEITALTGISPADVASQPMISAVLPDFLAFISGCLLVAHNAPFDMSFLNQAIIDCGIQGVAHFEVYDTLSEAKRLMKARSYALSNLKKDLGLSDLRSHDALNDVLITAKLYQRLQELDKPRAHFVAADSGQLGLFGEEISTELRKYLGLPITKALIYIDREAKQYEVISLRIAREYTSGSGLVLKLDTGAEIQIHADYFKEMQKPGFGE
jgi:DNA polymerase-3 subunit epsilon